MSRIIGIRRRLRGIIDPDKPEDLRPTQLWIEEEGCDPRLIEIESHLAELDFAKGKAAVSWRKATESDSPNNFKPHELRWRLANKPKKGKDGAPDTPAEDISSFPDGHTKVTGSGKRVKHWILDEVPDEFDGIRPGDVFVMPSGGAGRAYAIVLAAFGAKLTPNATVMVASSNPIKEERTSRKRKVDGDAELLTILYKEKPQLFFQLRLNDLARQKAILAFYERQEAMMKRIAIMQRRLAIHADNALLKAAEDPALDIAADANQESANDELLRLVEEYEDDTNGEMAKLVAELPEWKNALSDVQGIGPAIAMRIIAAIGDIRRFPRLNGFIAYMGAHLREGNFPRRKHGEAANWNPQGRQAGYLFADQANRRPDSDWGIKLAQYKAAMTAKNNLLPDLPKDMKWEAGYKKTKGAIHKAALWRVATRFYRWLWRKLWRLEHLTNSTPLPAGFKKK